MKGDTLASGGKSATFGPAKVSQEKWDAIFGKPEPKQKLVNMYDPPSGWRYGFPKPYKPRKGETLAQTLRRDGYPSYEIKNGGASHVRFWAEVR